MARNFEAALTRAGKPVDAKYYQQGGHNAFFSDATQRDDEVRRMMARRSTMVNPCVMKPPQSELDLLEGLASNSIAEKIALVVDADRR
jgi:uncharacterized glyoxalase superfamily metalloenzyme YdcJ